jgi:hypothetical protein
MLGGVVQFGEHRDWRACPFRVAAVRLSAEEQSTATQKEGRHVF